MPRVAAGSASAIAKERAGRCAGSAAGGGTSVLMGAAGKERILQRSRRGPLFSMPLYAGVIAPQGATHACVADPPGRRRMF
jgi:hypothetical protein